MKCNSHGKGEEANSKQSNSIIPNSNSNSNSNETNLFSGELSMVHCCSDNTKTSPKYHPISPIRVPTDGETRSGSTTHNSDSLHFHWMEEKERVKVEATNEKPDQAHLCVCVCICVASSGLRTHAGKRWIREGRGERERWTVLFTWSYQTATRGGYGIFTIRDYQWVLGPKPR